MDKPGWDLHRAANELAEACHEIRHHQGALKRARARRNAALVDLHQGGVPKCHLAKGMRFWLSSRGFAPEDIDSLGLSPGSMRVILDRSRSDSPEQPDETS